MLSNNRRHHGCFHRATHHVATVLFVIFCTVLVFAIVQAYKDTIDYIIPDLENRVIVGWVVSGIGLAIVIFILLVSRNTTADITLGHFTSATSSSLSSTVTSTSNTASTPSNTVVPVVTVVNPSEEGKPRRRQTSTTPKKQQQQRYNPYGNVR